MNKKLISRNISHELGINKSLSERFVDAFINLIKDSSKKGNVKLSNFGTFYSHRTSKRIGRNPKTKESYIIDPMVKLKLKPSNKIKKTLN